MITCFRCKEILFIVNECDTDLLFVCSDFNKKCDVNNVKKNTEYCKTIITCTNDPLYTKIICNCGNLFYTDFPTETMPPSTDCPYCGKLHVKQ